MSGRGQGQADPGLSAAEGRKMMDMIEHLTAQMEAMRTNAPPAAAQPALLTNFDIPEDEYLRPSAWRPESLQTDIQRDDLMRRLDKWALTKARELQRHFDVADGERALRRMKDVLRAMSEQYRNHKLWDANLIHLLEEMIGDLLYFKIANEDGQAEAEYYKSLRLNKSLPDSLSKIYEETRRFRRDRAVANMRRSSRAPKSDSK